MGIKKNKLIAVLFSLWAVVLLIMVLIGYSHPLFPLSKEDATVQYVFSTIAQTIAALYGLIITGHVFLRNGLRQEETEKENRFKKFPIDDLLVKNFRFLVYLGSFCLLSISFSLVAIMIDNYYWSIFIYNFVGALTLIDLISILIFIIGMLNPSNIKVQSKIIINKTTRELVDNTILLYIGTTWEKLEKTAFNDDLTFKRNPPPELSVNSSSDMFALISIKLQINGSNFLELNDNKDKFEYTGYIDKEFNSYDLASSSYPFTYYERLVDFAKFYIFSEINIDHYYYNEKKEELIEDKQKTDFKTNIIDQFKKLIKCLGLLVIVDPNKSVYEYDKTLYHIANSYIWLLSKISDSLDTKRSSDNN